MKFTIYEIGSGRIVKHFMGTLSQLEANVPDGCSAVPGSHDPRSQKIDHESREPYDWIPPQPSPRHEWSAEQRRWRLSAVAQTQDSALDEIRRLEDSVQPRALREAALGSEEGRARLQAVEDRIAELRVQLSSG